MALRLWELGGGNSEVRVPASSPKMTWRENFADKLFVVDVDDDVVVVVLFLFSLMLLLTFILSLLLQMSEKFRPDATKKEKADFLTSKREKKTFDAGKRLFWLCYHKLF